MTQLNTMENVNFVALTDEKLAEMEGGLAPIVIGGVIIGWKVVGAVAGVVGTGLIVVGAAGYYANRP